MKHLILCREYPPAPYPPGGIGTYVAHVSRALAERGETVHVIGQRWEGADKDVETFCQGRLIVHRISADDAPLYPALGLSPKTARAEVAAMLVSGFPAQWFSWVAAGLAERLIEGHGIDVIEGQEWEAPLYYLMLRRAMGLGPERKPPCIVHLHSPTEFIFRYNEWSLARADYLPMKRFEDYAIRAADAHLCPSRYLAAQCEPHYALEPGSIKVIPLPLGDTRPLKRDAEVWKNGSICYFGRLEPRKGVIEWIDAAVSVALQNPAPRFEFIGSDLPYTEHCTVRGHIEQRIPASVRDRFTFHAARPRAELLAMLGGARIGVVPSRWENFPNTCLEAMCSGLPVLATRNGGMSEMIEDGHTGWLTDDDNVPLPDRLAKTLQRALATPPGKMAKMGAAASRAVHMFCDNDRIANNHIAVRREIASRVGGRSNSLPPCFPWPEQATRPHPHKSAPRAGEGLAIVIIALRDAPAAQSLASVASQTTPPAAVILVAPKPLESGAEALPGYRFVRYDGASGSVARKLGMEADHQLKPEGWLFLNAGDMLDPWATEIFLNALREVPTAGILTSWSRSNHGLVRLQSLPPAFPYQWLDNEADGLAVYRDAAIWDAGGLRAELEDNLDRWDLANAIMAAGWAAMPVPATLGEHDVSPKPDGTIPMPRMRGRSSLIRRFPDLLALDAPALVSLLEARSSETKPSAALSRESIKGLVSILRRPLRDQAAMVLVAARQPIRTTHWLLWRTKNIIKRPIFRARDLVLGRK